MGFLGGGFFGSGGKADSGNTTTTNTTTSTVQDFDGADFSTDNAIHGANANNSGTINTSDYGAINSALAFANATSGTNAIITEQSLSLANESMNSSASLASEGFSLSESLFSTSAELVDNINSRTIDSAAALHSAGLQQLNLGTEFISTLNQQSLDNNLQSQQDNNDALVQGFASSMQFVEDFSRSDGAAVAETNMKTIGVLAVSGVLIALVLKKGK